MRCTHPPAWRCPSGTHAGIAARLGEECTQAICSKGGFDVLIGRTADQPLQRQDARTNIDHAACDDPQGGGFDDRSQPEGSHQSRTRRQKNAARRRHFDLAEREGFEPSIRLLTRYSLSRGAPSASRASLRVCCIVARRLAADQVTTLNCVPGWRLCLVATTSRQIGREGYRLSLRG